MARPAQLTNSVKLVVYVSPALYSKLIDFKDNYNFAYEAEVIRVALSKLLNENSDPFPFPVSSLNNNKTKNNG